MKFGKAFRTEREIRGISQREMARRLGITPVALWKIEAGRTTPKWHTIRRFIGDMHIPTAYFFSLAMDLEDYICP